MKKAEIGTDKSKPCNYWQWSDRRLLSALGKDLGANDKARMMRVLRHRNINPITGEGMEC